MIPKLKLGVNEKLVLLKPAFIKTRDSQLALSEIGQFPSLSLDLPLKVSAARAKFKRMPILAHNRQAKIQWRESRKKKGYPP